VLAALVLAALVVCAAVKKRQRYKAVGIRQRTRVLAALFLRWRCALSRGIRQ
jgi:hypothetical protein